MKDTKPKPKPSRLPLREPAKPLSEPPARELSADHPIHALIDPAKAAEAPTTHQPTTYQPPPTTQSIAPTRDFVRVPNSVVRDALPAGLFKGESKKTWDALYQRTRGAVVPRRMIRATLADVMTWAGVSHNTLKAHLKHLARVGLVKVHYVRGDNTGAEYEVFTPEEAPPTTHQPETTYQPPTSQNVAPPTNQNLVLGGGGQTVDFQRATGEPKTEFILNTERTTDDEAMPTLRARVGKPMPKTEAVLLSLLDTLKGRTDVSSPDALMAHVLARKLAPRAAVGQRRPNEEQFRGGASNVEVTAEDLEEYERARAELSKNEEGK